LRVEVEPAKAAPEAFGAGPWARTPCQSSGVGDGTGSVDTSGVVAGSGGGHSVGRSSSGCVNKRKSYNKHSVYYTIAGYYAPST
jgi:hypothetical protein